MLWWGTVSEVNVFSVLSHAGLMERRLPLLSFYRDGSAPLRHCLNRAFKSQGSFLCVVVSTEAMWDKPMLATTRLWLLWGSGEGGVLYSHLPACCLTIPYIQSTFTLACLKGTLQTCCITWMRVTSSARAQRKSDSGDLLPACLFLNI